MLGKAPNAFAFARLRQGPLQMEFSFKDTSSGAPPQTVPATLPFPIGTLDAKSAAGEVYHANREASHCPFAADGKANRKAYKIVLLNMVKQ